MILPAIWLQIGWHSIIAYVLHAFISHHQPLQSLHSRLKPGFILVIVAVVIKTVLEQLGYFYEPMATVQYYSFLVYNFGVTLFILWMYGTSLYALAKGGPAMAPTTKAIRDRLLAICTFLVVELVTRGVMISLRLAGHKPPVLYQALCNLVWLIWGFMDRY